MLSKRHADILKILDSKGTVTVTALASDLGVSAETVRRDLRPLMADAPLHLQGRRDEQEIHLWALDANGNVAMEARASLSSRG